MLGVVSEQFPKGGALALNFTGAVGMMGVGVIGAVILGFVQDKQLEQNLVIYDTKNKTELHSTYVTVEKQSLFGPYMAIDANKLLDATPETVETINMVQNDAKKSALRTVALFPLLMLIAYIGMIIFFISKKGGYKPVELEESA